MELSDRIFCIDRDWDPQYLREMISQNFYEFSDLWQNGICDKELVGAVDRAMATERYCPVVEDISIDDDTLYEAVAQKERE